MVIFGAGGDLTKRLVMPALYNLSRRKVLPEKFALIGVDLAEGTAESWRDHLYDMLKSFVGNAAAEFDVDRIDEGAWKRLAEKMSYVAGRPDQARALRKIRAALDEAEKLMAHRATPSSTSPSPTGSSVPWWSNSATRSSPIRARTRTGSAISGAAS